MSAIQTAIDRYEMPQAAVARHLQVTPQAVNQWVKGLRPVPPKHVLVIEADTGVTRHELRPDVFGAAAPKPRRKRSP
jgi:DNA-binding transcriptional regulator YdaS (Cro superfamily)